MSHALFKGTAGDSPWVIGMIHLGALPGTPRATHSIDQLVASALDEASIYQDAGVDALLIENMHDRPYLRAAVGPEIVACMTRVATEIRRGTALPCGIQILAAANTEALAVALAADLQFIRVEGFVFAHVADEGWIDGCAGDLLRERARLGADHVAVWADIKKKHSAHAVTSDVSLAETAQGAAYNLSDALVVTGSHTGEAASPEDLDAVAAAVPDLPLVVGSGITPENVAQYANAHGFIVGSALKSGSDWRNPVDPCRVAALISAAKSLSATSS